MFNVSRLDYLKILIPLLSFIFFLIGVFLPVRFSFESCGLLLNQIYAADSTWTGAVSSDWATAGNWSLNAVPDSLTNVTIPDATTTINDPNISPEASCLSLTISVAGVLNGNGNTINVYGNWTNSGVFNNGGGNLKFVGGANATFTPGSSDYYDLTLNKTNSVDLIFASDVNVLGDFIQNDGEMRSYQINLSGDYIIGSGSDGNVPCYNCSVTSVNFNNPTEDQQIVYSAGGIGAQIIIDKAGGNFIISDNVVLNGWTYVQGNVIGLDTHTLVLGDNFHGTFTPGSLVYSNIELNKTYSGGYNMLTVSGTATISGNLTHTDGELRNGQINLSGDYIISSLAEGAALSYGSTPTVINFNHAINNQQIVYSAGGIGAHIRIDKAGGNFTISDNVNVNGWSYIQGTVIGLDNHTLILGDDFNGAFVPGSLIYSNIEINKTYYAYDTLTVSGTATISGDLTHTDGELSGGQFDLSGDYVIGSLAEGIVSGNGVVASIINFNHSSNNQQIVCSTGGIGGHIRVDKSGGDLTFSSDITVSGWTYVQGGVVGLSSYSLILKDDYSGSFTPGGINYGSIEINRNGSLHYTFTISSGTLNMTGNLTLTDGSIRFDTNNPTLNISGNVNMAVDAVVYAGNNPWTVYGSWNNSGTFNHGNGSIIFRGTATATFTPGASLYYNVEINKTYEYGYYDDFVISGTATVVNNFTHTDGELRDGQIDLAGNYIIGSEADGGSSAYAPTIINFNHASNNQSVIYNSGGIGANIRVDKVGGNLNIASNINIVSWTYVQGAVVGLNTYRIIFSDACPSSFTPGSFSYNDIEVNKNNETGNYDDVSISGTAIVLEDVIQTDGEFINGQIDLSGDYIIASGSDGSASGHSPNVQSFINFNGIADQNIIYSTGGIGCGVIVNKTSGNLIISNDIIVNSWVYTQGNVVGIENHILTLGDSYYGTFTPGSLLYGGIVINKTNHTGSWDDVTVAAGTLNVVGDFVLNEGQIRLDTNNPSINVSGNLTIATSNTYFTKGTGVITFNGTSPSVFTDNSVTTQNIGKIVINKTNTNELQNKLTLASNMTCDTLSVDGTSGQADTFDLGSGGYILILSNSGSTANVFSLNGSLVAGTSTVKYVATNSAGNINVASGAYSSLEFSGAETYILSGAIDVAGNITIGSSSTFNSATYDIILSGNFTNSNIFIPNTNAVTLDGISQSLLGNISFYDLIKQVSASDSLTFQAGSTVAINSGGTLTLKGQDRDNLLSLISSSVDTQWNLNVNVAATSDLDYLNVKDSNASGQALSVLNSTNSGNNTNWTIISNTAPSATSPILSNSLDGTGYVTIQTTVDDIDNDNNIKLKVEYSLDGGNIWLDPTLVAYITTSPDQVIEPDINNSNIYQIGTVNPIQTSAGANILTFKWDTKADAVSYETSIKIKVTPMDSMDGGTSTVSASNLIVDNRGGIAFIPPPKPIIDPRAVAESDASLIPSNVIQIAISRNSDFIDTAWIDFDRDKFSYMKECSDILYIKFRTRQGAVSDVFTYYPLNSPILRDGDIVKTSDNFDVYIIKIKNNNKYRRLILSPSVFKSYQHLKWSNLKIISLVEMSQYSLSNLARETNDTIVYKLVPLGDTGERRVYDTSSSDYDPNSVYEINTVDRDSYIMRN